MQFRKMAERHDAILQNGRAIKVQLLKAPRNYDAIPQNQRAPMMQIYLTAVQPQCNF
jgi:hypothetical protein